MPSFNSFSKFMGLLTCVLWLGTACLIAYFSLEFIIDSQSLATTIIILCLALGLILLAVYQARKEFLNFKSPPIASKLPFSTTQTLNKVSRTSALTSDDYSMAEKTLKLLLEYGLISSAPIAQASFFCHLQKMGFTSPIDFSDILATLHEMEFFADRPTLEHLALFTNGVEQFENSCIEIVSCLKKISDGILAIDIVNISLSDIDDRPTSWDKTATMTFKLHQKSCQWEFILPGKYLPSELFEHMGKLMNTLDDRYILAQCNAFDTCIIFLERQHLDSLNSAIEALNPGNREIAAFSPLYNDDLIP
ncbi:MAG: hypothetical protein ACRBHB_15640 [Arenicella sp.]